MGMVWSIGRQKINSAGLWVFSIIGNERVGWFDSSKVFVQEFKLNISSVPNNC